MKIIYFDIDCLRPDHLSCYGYSRPTSPNIDTIARQGTRFDHYYCSSSPCLPSRTAWLSGRFGIRNGVISNIGQGARFQIRKKDYGGPAAEYDVFPRQLRRFGYDTISISNFSDRHNAWYFMCGWSEYYTPNLKAGLETADEVNALALRWLDHNAERDNYFLHINYWDTHRTYRIPESLAERFIDYPVELPWPDEATITQHQNISGPFTACGQFKDNISPYPLMPGSIENRADFEKMITAYDAAIAYVDNHIGEVMAKLEYLGLLDDTVLIVSSDHGDAFGEHGIYTDHVCADECIHKIPLIVRWPGNAKENFLNSAFLYNTDFSSTFCDILQIPQPSAWSGQSFAANLKGETGLQRDFLVWDHALYTVQRAVRVKDYLMLKTYDDYGYRFDPIELYDMNNDPYQTKNIAADRPEVVAACHHRLIKWLDEQYACSDFISDPLIEVLRERQAVSNE